MPANSTYEGMFLLDSTKAAVNWDETVNHVHGILTKHGAEVIASRPWQEQRLAFPVRGHRKGTYLLAYFKAEAGSVKEIVSDCHISEVILRELVLKVHPKLAETSVQQAMAATPGLDAEGRPEDDDDRPRRRRRDD
jgi:small subunit ribosomal protein S6